MRIPDDREGDWREGRLVGGGQPRGDARYNRQRCDGAKLQKGPAG